MKTWQTLRGKAVTVYASGITYSGTVVEMGEDTLVLKAVGGFQEIPWDRITRIDEDGSAPATGPGRDRDTLPQGWK